jgi:hypothetical protein
MRVSLIIAPKRLKLRLSGQLENHKNGFETRRCSNFRPFRLEPSRFFTQRRETERPIPIQMQKMVNYYAIRSTCE